MRWWVLVLVWWGIAVEAQPLRVLVTIAPLYEFTTVVAGKQAEVQLLVAPGTEVHDYQARPRDVDKIKQAQLLIQNGLGLEAFLEPLLRNGNPGLRRVDTSRGVSLLPEEADPDHPNPHIWLDPHRAQQQVRNIRDGLSAADPSHRGEYWANAQGLLQQLVALDVRYQRVLTPLKRRQFVALHNGFAYLAQRYQLQQTVIQPVTGALLSPRNVQATIVAVRRYQVSMMLSTPGLDSRILQVL
uniref:metal ABC transporter substrate-binding protein n=2 Tax=Candidatus Cyanaurora vandensis TaxID=2714958 RepID=UPI00257D374B